MKSISHPLFILLFTIYIIYYSLKTIGLSMPEFITSYLADLLSLFLVNTVITWIIRTIKSDKYYELNPAMVVLSFVMFSLFFELYLPSVNYYYKTDFWDIFCYALSAFGFLFWRRKKSLFE
jgi:hypothetical protein